MDRAIEEKWRKEWEREKIFEAKVDTTREKILATFPFPYMNGPLHVGHAFTASRVDAYVRFKRMQGFNSLFPFSWHWTGQPLVAAAERLSRKDPAMIKEFVEIDKVPSEEISKFYDPVYMAKYYTNDGREALQRLGLSIDWRREFHTTDLEPAFNKFILWQMNKLREKGYIRRGTHPVVWCPRDQSPTGDHDRLSGEGVTWEEFTLVLFPLKGNANQKLPAATFRPETIFGATNIWINPKASYAEIRVNDDAWIVSSKAVLKLKEQLKKIEVVREFQGKELVGQKVANPLDPERTLPILPASFVDPDNGSGVVYSVPAHAPFDYVALRDLQQSKSLEQDYGLPVDAVRSIEPIELISLGDKASSAKEIVEDMGITNQEDPKLEQATAEIYKREFHQGTLNKNAAPYEGRKVSDVKALIIKDLKEKKLADSMLELPEKVVCRCMTECIIKILEDQWFLTYSDQKWKELAHRCIDLAQIYPETARQAFHDVIDWLRDWPCARRVGLGTPLPWSPGWIVETLSDSTIYPAFYTINSTIKEKEISPDSLTESLFSYVFLGEGSPSATSKECGLGEQLIQQMREEFVYWYPVNLRNSAKELIPNHLTFFVFQHVAFFEEKFWPTAISANGMMKNEGVKMSKSKGNLVTLKSALDEFGADVVRAAVLGGAEGMDDVDWREKSLKDIMSKINALPSFVHDLVAKKEGRSSSQEDIWLESQLQRRIQIVTSDLQEMKTKSAFQNAFFGIWNDIRYYQRRKGDQYVDESIVRTWVRLLSPFIPYVAEEINSQIGGEGLVSVSKFPVSDEGKIRVDVELKEESLKRLVDDVQKIMKLIPSKPTILYVYVASSWMCELMREVTMMKLQGEDRLPILFEKFPKKEKKEIASLVPRLKKILNELGSDFIDSYLASYSVVDEKSIYEDSRSFLEREFGLRVVVNQVDSADYDPKGKALFALPFKPALYLE
ncbi:MAG: leucine--tRNA ligase [Nitrososphaerales archaeon]